MLMSHMLISLNEYDFGLGSRKVLLSMKKLKAGYSEVGGLKYRDFVGVVQFLFS